MDVTKTCCSKDKYALSFPSFSAVFIHTFMLDGDVVVEDKMEWNGKLLDDELNSMRKVLNDEPAKGTVPISSLVEYITKDEAKPDTHFIKMASEVEELLFPVVTLKKKQIARYSMRGFDFCIPIRSAKEQNEQGEYVLDFPSLDFVGHANVEVSQFFGNIFSITYRFLFDGYTCKILVAGDDASQGDTFPFRFDTDDRQTTEATTNHLISLLSSCLGAEYWSGDDDDDDELAGIDLKNRLAVRRIWLDSMGKPVERDAAGNIVKKGAKAKWEDPYPEIENGVWPIENKDRVFDEVLLRYKRFIARRFTKESEVSISKMSVSDDSRYAMVDIWETVQHPYGASGTRDLFSSKHWPKLTEAEIINHIRDYHKPEMVGLMTMYPAEWPYRAAEAYDEVCGENIAIDTDDLVLAGSHLTVVIGTYGRRGDGVEGVNWESVMQDRRFYHVSWEEYLLILQFVLAKKYTFSHAVDTLLGLTEDMSEVTKATIGECSKQALLASKKAIELDVIKHMKFPSHKVMYDRTMRRLDLEADFQRFKDVQDVVSSNLQSLGEFHAAQADSFMNKLLIGISVLSLVELAFQQSEWPFVEKIFACNIPGWERVASIVSGIAAAIVGAIALYGIYYGVRKLCKKKKRR